MKRFWRLLSLFLLCSCLLGNTESAEQESILPFLSEPTWSPLPVPQGPRGISTPWTYDTANGLVAFDIDNDQRDEILLGGSDIHIMDISSEPPFVSWSRLPLGDTEDTQSLRIRWIGIEDIDKNGIEEVCIISYPDELRVFVFDDATARYSELNPETPRLLTSPLVALDFLDYNGDEYSDLLVCNRDSANGGVCVLFGDADATLGHPVPLDGLSDAVWDSVPGIYAEQRGIWLLTHDSLWFSELGSMKAEEVLNVGGTSLEVLDIDTDGSQEVILASSEKLTIWCATGRTLELVHEITYAEDAVRVLAGDFDGDQALDLCLVKAYSSEFMLLFAEKGMPGSGRIQMTAGDISFQSDPIIGDLNGDGCADLVYADRDQHVGLALSGVPGYLLQPFLGDSVVGATGNDLLCGTADGAISYLESSDDLTFASYLLVDVPFLAEESIWRPLAAQMADVTICDGEELVVLGHTDTASYLIVWEQQDESVWIQAYSCTLDTQFDSFVVANIDGRSRNEIVLVSENRLSVWAEPTSAADNGCTEDVEWRSGLLSAHAAYSDDEILVFSTNTTSKDVSLLRFRENELVEVQPLLTHTIPVASVTTDLNDDNMKDVVLIGVEVATAKNTGGYRLKLVHLIANGDGTFREEYPAIPSALDPALPLAAFGGDFTGDGRPDIAVVLLVESLGLTQQLVLLPFDGRDYSGMHLGPASIHPHPISLDIDADGVNEIVQALRARQLAILKMDGTK
jgi:FG-GAP-like repeat